MATATNQSIEEEYQVLSVRQRLKAAVHYTSLQLCQETEDKYGVSISQQVVAAISETVWKQAESFAVDLELFAKHAKRSIINADDVKLLVRRNPCLLQHIQGLHADQTSGPEAGKKRGRRKKADTDGVASKAENGPEETEDGETSNL